MLVSAMVHRVSCMLFWIWTALVWTHTCTHIRMHIYALQGGMGNTCNHALYIYTYTYAYKRTRTDTHTHMRARARTHSHTHNDTLTQTNRNTDTEPRRHTYID